MLTGFRGILEDWRGDADWDLVRVTKRTNDQSYDTFGWPLVAARKM